MPAFLSRVALFSALAMPIPAGAQVAVGQAVSWNPPWPAIGFWPIQTPMPVLVPEPPREMAAAPPQPPRRVPVPPKRPSGLGQPEIQGEPEPASDTADCLARLRATGANYVQVRQPGGNPACAIDRPVRLAALKRSEESGELVSLTDRPVVSCRLALQFDAWIKAAGPILAAGRNAPLVSMITGPGWECRTRNRQPGAPLSSHSNGLALDVNTFVFANKARLTVTGSGREPTFQTVRRAACTWFTTVLGPGSDGFHEDHLHVDIQPHGRGRHARYCR